MRGLADWADLHRSADCPHQWRFYRWYLSPALCLWNKMIVPFSGYSGLCKYQKCPVFLLMIVTSYSLTAMIGLIRIPSKCWCASSRKRIMTWWCFVSHEPTSKTHPILKSRLWNCFSSTRCFVAPFVTNWSGVHCSMDCALILLSPMARTPCWYGRCCNESKKFVR